MNRPLAWSELTPQERESVVGAYRLLVDAFANGAVTSNEE